MSSFAGTGIWKGWCWGERATAAALRAMTAREIALRALRESSKGRAFISEALDKEFKIHRPAQHERGLATELACGCVRRRGTLDWVIEQVAGRGMKAISPGLRDILRMGVYQLLYLGGIPDYAAVSESVELARRHCRPGSEKFVNAVLRRVPRGAANVSFPKREKSPARHIAVVHSHPAWLVERWIRRWGEAETEALCAANNETPALTLRANALRCGREELIERLAQEGVCARADERHPLAVDILDLPCPLPDLASFRDGLFQVQDVSAMRIVDLFGARGGETVADLCAGPGGKATGIAESMGDEGLVICLDRSEKKARMVRESAHRLRLESARVVVGDAGTAQSLLSRRSFDRVLVDAPCSNTGVLGRRPEARWRLKGIDIARLATLGLRLLTAGRSIVRPGGTIVYSTCSIEPEENEGVVSEFLRNETGFRMDSEIRFLPHRDGCDGGYAARLIENSIWYLGEMPGAIS